MLLWSQAAHAERFSGKVKLDRLDILVSDSAPYRGHFDLSSELPSQQDFILTNVRITFNFKDDKEWTIRSGEHIRQDTGRVERHKGQYPLSGMVTGQTDHYEKAVSTEVHSNPGEVAKLTIGRNIYYGTTSRRRQVTQIPQGQTTLLLGTYADTGDGGRLRQHYKITDRSLEQRLDGYDGYFTIQNKILDVTSAQDLAHRKRLDFELSGEGDYILLEATVWYEGQVSGELIPETPSVFFAKGSGLYGALAGGLVLGSFVWRRRGQGDDKAAGPPRRPRKTTKPQKQFPL
ncbi:hypothetical protein [Paremcibacter congregatus]|nr:hypothetical protein [Paremcibacter congregatus]QDE26663.1 hypothetical protein FIV45_04930 [Paremcibacter congregatus]